MSLESTLATLFRLGVFPKLSLVGSCVSVSVVHVEVIQELLASGRNPGPKRDLLLQWDMFAIKF